ncbi:MAG: hypothetical protein HRT44_08950 [Bdellovibrionales bacterium]|nr:hypothetical protein [Bdellovibrionales bacterium]NQZ19368.1 hypothetical protein [Bdellovibrionales bacterium]
MKSLVVLGILLSVGLGALYFSSQHLQPHAERAHWERDETLLLSFFEKAHEKLMTLKRANGAFPSTLEEAQIKVPTQIPVSLEYVPNGKAFKLKAELHKWIYSISDQRDSLKKELLKTENP